MMAEIQEKLKCLSITLFMFQLNNIEEGENSLREEGGF